MAVEVNRGSMGRVQVTTIDRYDNKRHYEFRSKYGTLQPKNGYTPVVLKALWKRGLVVDWSPDDLTASQRAEIDGFCDDCGTAIHSRQVGPDEFEHWCPDCDGHE